MNKKKATEQILNIISITESAMGLKNELYFIENGRKFDENFERIHVAFCGSWIGYHASVYYNNFQTPNPRDQFSAEWGLNHPYGSNKSSGWEIMKNDYVKSTLLNQIDADYESRLTQISNSAKLAFDNAHNKIMALLAILNESSPASLFEEINKSVADLPNSFSPEEIVKHYSPKGAMASRDALAVSQRIKIPPHIELKAWHLSENSPFTSLELLLKEAKKLLDYMEMQDIIEYNPKSNGSKIFIGHGRSLIWRELKDFLKDRLNLEWDEFNRESTAGTTTTERLQSMLDQACFALLVMTGEDQHPDETKHARENVIHEVGLFQAKLGTRKAIVLLEEGCTEFTNISGLTQLRFSKGNISAVFEDIRKVLEREGIINKI